MHSMSLVAAAAYCNQVPEMLDALSLRIPQWGIVSCNMLCIQVEDLLWVQDRAGVHRALQSPKNIPGFTTDVVATARSAWWQSCSLNRFGPKKT